MGTLKAMVALGYSIQPPRPLSSSPSSESVSTDSDPSSEFIVSWVANLQNGLDEITSPQTRSPRKWTFDMDDAPEIEALPKDRFKIARAALAFLHETIYPAWKEADSKAIERQGWHRIVATTAIVSGITAIISAILQLVMAQLSPEAGNVLAHFELVAILVALAAVVAGVFLHLHHGWLASRQQAERLRVLKFRALAWRELWCDFPAWKERVLKGMKTLDSLDSVTARKWAEEDYSSTYTPDQLAGCVVPAGDLAILAALHRIKRLQFQQHYFQFQSRKANPRSRIADWKVGMWLFFATVLVVLIHRFWHPEGAQFDACLIGLAALLPVIGFGLRAWLAAFETPRSRNLFRAKARALEQFISRDAAEARDPERFRGLVADGENVFTNEHREWCRLQLEAEWFV